MASPLPRYVTPLPFRINHSRPCSAPNTVDTLFFRRLDGCWVRVKGARWRWCLVTPRPQALRLCLIDTSRGARNNRRGRSCARCPGSLTALDKKLGLLDCA